MSESNPQVLLVEDDLAMQRLIAKWLVSAGYEVSSVRNGRDAMTMIETCCPNIVLTDWDMPDVDGLALCKWIRSQQLPRYVYTIVSTVRSGTPDVIRCLESGADDFLRKPIDRGELLARFMAGMRVSELEKRLNELANLDSLTGLASQRLFYERMQVEWTRAQRYGLPLSCVMIDIDYFKRVNDCYGHPVGDVVIRTMAETLRENCRSCDVISRYGGEEFCALLPETDEFHAAAWAERIRKEVARRCITVKGREITITASFGVAQQLADTSFPSALVDLADQSLLVAKRSGRDRVVSYGALNAIDGFSNVGGATDMLASVPAEQVMTSLLTGLSQNAMVGKAARYFLANGISSAPVVNEEGKLVGNLTESDLMSVMLCPGWWKVPINEVMKTDYVSFDQESPALAVYEFLCRVSLRNAIIVKDGCPTGVISRLGILRWFTNCLAVGMIPSVDSHDLQQFHTDTAVTAPFEPESKLQATLEAIGGEVNSLRDQVALDSLELVPSIVGGASRMQELVGDLLSCSRAIQMPDSHLAPENATIGIAANLNEAQC